ncbi:hypothetical protein ACFFQW_26715 [Umezawaea endophytica]|uniref:Uncharacterized protein n=1 Tax=Umezawaea endophytica TaxID=1654476 RepID=A0A9X2VW57_9PSEU|nr:hypothetical protein [Umezawaea endophytica]MCS7483129.1 hypothetical protein [Umezawaea endophytica]
MTSANNSDLHRALGELRRCLGALRAAHGDHAAIRRLVNGVERLEIDAADLLGLAPASGYPADEVVYVSDAPYDPDLWSHADDEGIGGYRPHIA